MSKPLGGVGGGVGWGVINLASAAARRTCMPDSPPLLPPQKMRMHTRAHTRTHVTRARSHAHTQGFENALAAGATEVAIFTAASEAFCRRNTNCSIDESLRRFDDVAAAARAEGVAVRGYVSCVVGCPYQVRACARRPALLLLLEGPGRGLGGAWAASLCGHGTRALRWPAVRRCRSPRCAPPPPPLPPQGEVPAERAAHVAGALYSMGCYEVRWRVEGSGRGVGMGEPAAGAGWLPRSPSDPGPPACLRARAAAGVDGRHHRRGHPCLCGSHVRGLHAGKRPRCRPGGMAGWLLEQQWHTMGALLLGCYGPPQPHPLPPTHPQTSTCTFMLQVVPVNRLAAHLHDTYGMAVANTLAALQARDAWASNAAPAPPTQPGRAPACWPRSPPAGARRPRPADGHRHL